MLHITATADGEELKLVDGQSIEISFPTEKKESDMQLFTGSWKNETIINWTPQMNIEAEIFTVVEEAPRFAVGDVRDYLKANLVYPEKAKELGVQGTVYITFIISDKGKITDPRILRGVMPELDEAALNVVKQMPDWKPAKQRGKNVNIQYNLPIKFILEGVAVNYNEQFERIYSDTTMIQKTSSATIFYYVLNSTQLEWINCDRFINTTPSTNYMVKSDNEIEDIKIIFNRLKSVMEVIPEKGISTFKVPAGEDITIVAFKHIDNILHLAVKQSNTSVHVEKDLVFQPVTLELLKDEMQKFDKKYN